MVSQRLHLAACFAACLFACGGCTAFRCGGAACGDGCAKKSPYAGMKYEGACETCGGCSNCGCGDQIACGDACDGNCATRAGGCASGAASCVSGGCGKQSPCWLLNGVATCAGCGERYWNEWYNDPPTCAEPCDCNGNWIGPGHGGYYRAPYVTGGYVVGQAPSVPPLELADADAAEAVAAKAIEQSDSDVEAALTAGYDDEELADGLR